MCCIARSAPRNAPPSAREQLRRSRACTVDGGQRRPRPLDLGGVRALVRVGLRRTGRTPSARRDPRATTAKNLYDGVPLEEVYKSAILSARALIEKDPAYSLRHRAPAAAHDPPRGARRGGRRRPQMATRYAEYFPEFISRASRPSCSTSGSRSSTSSGSARRSSPSATCSSPTSACRRCTTATSCTSTAHASSCRRPSSCAWRWAWR